MIEHLARAWGGPVGTGRIRVSPEDFVVDEVLGFEPGGGGEHAWLHVRKRGVNTMDVAADLAGFAGVPVRKVGFSGMKDRHALTSQWFSVHLPGRDDPDWGCAGRDRGWWVEKVCRGGRKLRTGSHRGNRFTIRIRDLHADPEAMRSRLQRVAAEGFPNYFGPQRFGRNGQNLARARRSLGGDGPRQRVRGIQLSAARSWLFNRVLHCRILEGSWNRPCPGDALMLAGTHSIFAHDGSDPDVPARVEALDLDVTGPLWGCGRLPLGRNIARCEREWLAQEAALREGLERIGMTARRRALRAPAEGLSWGSEDGLLVLRFTLRRGVFATSLLRELLVLDEGATDDPADTAWTPSSTLQ